jgi:CDP-glucose 4,6-dehydratase
MESMELTQLFGHIYKNKNVLVTGHTGFKGSWLVLWLQKMGANVTAFAQKSPYSPCHFDLLKNNQIKSVIGNITEYDALEKTFSEAKPEIVFHLAAQALVRESYKNPIETYQTNVLGTLNVYEVARNCESVKAILSITTDKVYQNNEWVWAYRENDVLGGYDPYSASKACVEIMTNSYKKSFLNKNLLIATARAGNVVGGGDWAKDRLFPDMMKAVEKSEKVRIRNPNAIRPWQHVLEPIAGYLQLGKKMLEGKDAFAEAWNFAPDTQQCLSVEKILEISKKSWDKIDFEIEKLANQPHEAMSLKLDSSKANTLLNWKPIWDISQTIEKTIDWYKNWIEAKQVITESQLIQYVKDAKEKKVEWV